MSCEPDVTSTFPQIQTGEEEDEDTSILTSTADRTCHLMLRAAPLPGKVADLLLDHQDVLKVICCCKLISHLSKCQLECLSTYNNAV